MRIVCTTLLAVLATMAFVPVMATAKPHPAKQAGGSDDVDLQVAALTSLQELDLTNEQLKRLKELAGAVIPGKRVGEPRQSDALKAALAELRDALAADDHDKIGDAQEKVGMAREQDKAVTAPEVEITESARQKAPDAIAILKASQLAGYFAAHQDDVPDPLQTMTDALDQIAEAAAPEEYAAIRTETSGQVALLLAGLDPAAQQPIAQKVGQWLDKAHAMDAGKRTAHRPALEQAAKELVGHPDPFQALRHWSEREMASLLSNPALPFALDKQLANPAGD